MSDEMWDAVRAVTVSGAKTSQVTLEVAEAASGLPPTGAPPGSGDDGVAAWQIAFPALGAAALTGGLMIIARRNGRV